MSTLFKRLNIRSNWHWLLLFALLIASLYDLFAPPISRSVYRQTQTAMLTENFVGQGFSLRGLHVNFHGNTKPVMVYEFPVYNFIVGLFYRIGGPHPFWGKLVSLACTGIALSYLYRIVKRRFGDDTAIWCSVFFIFSPVSRLLTTSFQPDAFGLMSILIAIAHLEAWQQKRRLLNLMAISLALLLAGLAKFPLLVPYMPLFFLGLLFEGRKIRIPRLAELAVMLVLFVLPFLGWFAYRRGLMNPLFSSDAQLARMFFIGDLSRFLSVAYYVKAGVNLSVLILSVAGLVFFCFGLKRVSGLEISLLSGIALYYVLIPTAADQWYYPFACLPTFALVMAKGLSELARISRARRHAAILWCLGTLYVVGFVVGTQYALNQDRVSYEAAESVRQTTGRDDLVFSITMHDRGNGFGGNNPTMLYLSRRRGWNFQGTNIPDSVVPQVEALRSKGVRWVVATRFTPDQELWFARFIPAKFRRNPRVDSNEVFRRLNEKYHTVVLTKNYTVLDVGNAS